MRSRRWTSTPWLAVLLLSACTFGSGPQPATSGSSPVSPASPASSGPATVAPPASRTAGSGTAPASGSGSGRSSPAATRASSRLLQVTPTVRIPLAGQTYGRGLVLWEHYAAWVGCDGCQRTFTEPTTLYVADLTSRRVRAVATAPRHGEVDPLGGSGSRLVYIEGDSTRKWTIYALDVAGGARSALAGSTAASGDLPPVAAVGDDQLVWQTFGKGPGDPTHGPVNAIDLRTGSRRTVSRDLPGVLGTITRTGLVYRALSAAGAPLDQGPTDAFLLRSDRRQAVVLSETHDVRDIIADDTTAAWQTNDGPDAGAWAAPLDGQGPAREFYRGGTGDRAVGAGFLAVVTSGDDPVVLLYPLTGGPVVALGDVPGEFDAMAAEGARLAYLALPVDRGVQPDAKHPLALVVDSVAPPGS